MRGVEVKRFSSRRADVNCGNETKHETQNPNLEILKSQNNNVSNDEQRTTNIAAVSTTMLDLAGDW
jgi:hypothetical protein